MKICLVSNTAWSIYNYRRGLLHAFAQADIKVTILAPRDATFAVLETMGFTCIDLPLSSKGTRPRDDVATCVTLFRYYRRLRPDVVIHYTIKANIYGSLAAALARVPSIAVTTGLGYVFLHDNRVAHIAQSLYRFAFRFPREVWFLNPDDHATFVTRRLLAHPERARLLKGEGVDLTHFSPRPNVIEQNVDHIDADQAPAVFRFLLIGRLLRDKGVGEFIAAARLLQPTHAHVRWQLLGPVGAANPSAIDHDTVSAWVAEGIIDYLGETHDVRDAIARADCIVLPSYREGVPRTLLEAGAMGKMSIATRVPGCIDIVEDGINGILCEARSAEALASAMSRMLDMTQTQRLTMARAARHKVEREFDERQVIRVYEQALQGITGKPISLSGKNE